MLDAAGELFEKFSSKYRSSEDPFLVLLTYEKFVCF